MVEVNEASQSQNDDELLVADNATTEMPRSRMKVFLGSLVISGVVAGAIASSTEVMKGSSTVRVTKKFFPIPWMCTHWTTHEKAAIQANADQKKLCELKGMKDVDFEVAWRPNGSPCPATACSSSPATSYSTDCCERQKWQCEDWSADDIKAINANADEKLLCEKKVKDSHSFTENVVYK